MQKQKTLSKILTEAMEICIIEIGKGLPASAKKEMAKIAGVSIPTIHRYLRKGKENDILWSALNEVLEERKRKLNDMQAKAGIEPIEK